MINFGAQLSFKDRKKLAETYSLWQETREGVKNDPRNVIAWLDYQGFINSSEGVKFLQVSGRTQRMSADRPNVSNTPKSADGTSLPELSELSVQVTRD